MHHSFGKERAVHRDIKPANILLTARLNCKLADFGGSRMAILTENLSQPRRWEKGTVYTRGYADPKLIVSKVGLSKSMDVYSVGATLYMILRRQNPPQHLTKDYLDACTCDICDVQHFEFIKKNIINCCKEVDRPGIEAVLHELKKHLNGCTGCSSTNINQLIDAVLKIYQINSPNTEFSSSKVLDNAGCKDFCLGLYSDMNAE